MNNKIFRESRLLSIFSGINKTYINSRYYYCYEKLE